MAAPSTEEQKHFVDEHEEELIHRISNVEAVLSQLLQDRLLISEEYEAVRTRTTSHGRMRKLFSFARDWSASQKDKLYQALKSNDPAAVGTMERTAEPEHNEEVEMYKMKLRERVKSHFELLKDRNSRLGESFPLRRRYTTLVLLRCGRGEEERKRELSCSGEEHLQILNERSSGEYSPTSIAELFDPDDNGVVPQTVVIHGPTGIGKSLTAHKVCYDWATSDIYRHIHFLFYISYKDFTKISTKVNLVGLLAKSYKLSYPPEVMRDILRPGEKLGFIINGFDQMEWTLKDESAVCEDPFKESHKEVLLRSLLRGCLLKGVSLIITTRSFELEKLQTLLPDPPRLVEIVGYTGEARERYIRTYFDNKEPGVKAVNIIKKKEALYTMCSVPFMCWVVSTVTRQQISKYPSNFTTDTSMFLYYLKGLLIYHSHNDNMAPTLKKICALANDGLLNQRVLFEEEDLRRHKLSVSAPESVFLNSQVFHGDNGKRTCYSFIHHSFQELLAVVHYGLPGEGGEDRGSSRLREVRESTYLPEICKGRSLKELLHKHPHLARAVRFLFGLLNQNQNKDFTKTSGCSLFFQGTTAMIDWLFGGEVSDFDTERLDFLYETRDDDFIQSVVSCAVDLTFSQCQQPDNWVYQLAFCLKACAGRKVTLSGYVLDRDHLLVLIPLLKKCPQVCFRSCRFAADVTPPPSTGWKTSMFTSLITQDSQIEELSLLGCVLPPSTCDVLDNAGRQSRSLSTLHVMFKVDTKEEREEMRRFYETFKSADCSMSTRRMMGRTWFMLRCKLERMFPFELTGGRHMMGRHMTWDDMFDREELPFDFRSRILYSRRHL